MKKNERSVVSPNIIICNNVLIMRKESVESLVQTLIYWHKLHTISNYTRAKKKQVICNLDSEKRLQTYLNLYMWNR